MLPSSSVSPHTKGRNLSSGPTNEKMKSIVSVTSPTMESFERKNRFITIRPGERVLTLSAIDIFSFSATLSSAISASSISASVFACSLSSGISARVTFSSIIFSSTYFLIFSPGLFPIREPVSGRLSGFFCEDLIENQFSPFRLFGKLNSRVNYCVHKVREKCSDDGKHCKEHIVSHNKRYIALLERHIRLLTYTGD